MFRSKTKLFPVFKVEYPNSKVLRGAKSEVYLVSVTLTIVHTTYPHLQAGRAKIIERTSIRDACFACRSVKILVMMLEKIEKKKE